MKKESGFTLIELMICVAIVGILVALALPRFNELVYQSKVRVAQEQGLPMPEKPASMVAREQAQKATTGAKPMGNTTSYALDWWGWQSANTLTRRDYIAIQLYAMAIASGNYSGVDKAWAYRRADEFIGK